MANGKDVNFGNGLIRQYFLDGFSYSEIRYLLDASNNIQISTRHVNRILRSMNLFRRSINSPTNIVLNAVPTEIRRVLWVSPNDTNTEIKWFECRSRCAIKSLDPKGVEQRSIHRFKRRKYHSVGPNHLWHLDGYDKLKPFGLAIHGAIDDWSRKILWLRVASTNNNPKIVTSYSCV